MKYEKKSFKEQHPPAYLMKKGLTIKFVKRFLNAIHFEIVFLTVK